MGRSKGATVFAGDCSAYRLPADRQKRGEFRSRPHRSAERIGRSAGTMWPMTSDVASRQLFQLERLLGEDWRHLREADHATRALLETVHSAVGDVSTEDMSFVVFGSAARGEVTSGSDLDWTLLVDGISDPQHIDTAFGVEERLKSVGIKPPGREGTFGRCTFGHDLIHYIGGQDDTNTNTTRRLLLLLESAAIGRTDAYDRVLRNVLQRYLTEDYGWVYGRNPKNVPRFLHNDIARYWRTVAVDFAYKQRQRGGEGWALRGAKLRLSRKLTYASGLLYAFSCATNTSVNKLRPGDQSRTQAVIAHLWEMSRRMPLDIVAEIFVGQESLYPAAREVFGAYNDFIGLLNDREKRDGLFALPPAEADGDETYQMVRNLGHKFQGGLNAVFLEPNDTALFELTRTFGVF